ncbi:MAG: YlbF family regulator [Lachnospiraceae bacterium]|nr:YlbF family regulator [Lachnospiraceae bacterium]
MNNVQKAANQMIDAIKASDIYQEYEKQLAVVKAQPELKHQIDEFRRRNYELQNSADCAFDKLEQFEQEYEEFRENPLVSDFLAAELAFCRMMQEVNIRIIGAMHFE